MSNKYLSGSIQSILLGKTQLILKRISVYRLNYSLYLSIIYYTKKYRVFKDSSTSFKKREILIYKAKER